MPARGIICTYCAISCAGQLHQALVRAVDPPPSRRDTSRRHARRACTTFPPRQVVLKSGPSVAAQRHFAPRSASLRAARRT